MPPFSRGFRGRRVEVDLARVPPGQYVTRDFAGVSTGPTPHTPRDEWSFTISGAVETLESWPRERSSDDVLYRDQPARLATVRRVAGVA